ncbi:MAG: hypothetical protein KC419_18790 [Anaerolineales bacterium]|nr:hypothetical protein [Anaerolineales bacterium]MCA9930542.1 hypothetical protein [Anaerolineales bacterium]
MSNWAIFVLGLLIGWGIELIIDYFFWRRKESNIDESAWQQRVDAAEMKMRDLEVKLKDAMNREPERVVETVIKEVMIEKDRLQDVKGIGKVFAGKLNKAGIFTFAHLADSNPERLTEIIQPQEWQAIEPKEWIEHAKELAGQKAAQAD